jgi:hypothetical protein
MHPAYTDWTGLYVGGFGGVGCLEANLPPPYISIDPIWPAASVWPAIYGGYDYHDRLLSARIEGDYGWTIDGHLAFAGGEEQTNYALDALATARGPRRLAAEREHPHLLHRRRRLAQYHF